jgi:hypothetical protein
MILQVRAWYIGCSHSLELEKELASRVGQQVVSSVYRYVTFPKQNGVTENSAPSGSETTHTRHEIVIQRVKKCSGRTDKRINFDHGKVNTAELSIHSTNNKSVLTQKAS